MSAVLAFASPINAGRFGEFRSSPRGPARFTGRIGTPAHPVQADRYHLYLAWSCPASHRLAILRELAGLSDIVSQSHVDALRDARGWAFRPATGPDPINGFTLLREAYQRTMPGYEGPLTVPVLWDRETDTIVSSDPRGIGVDLLTRFGSSCELYRPQDQAAIAHAAATIIRDIERLMGRAMYQRADARALLASFTSLDEHLRTHHFVVADRLTDADVRLWVLLARYDAGPNAHGAIGPRLDSYPALWRWARSLYTLDGFQRATSFARFAARPEHLPPWNDAAVE